MLFGRTTSQGAKRDFTTKRLDSKTIAAIGNIDITPIVIKIVIWTKEIVVWGIQAIKCKKHKTQ